jgi:DNA repair protein radA
MPRNEKEFPNLKIFGVSSLQEAIEICRDAENSA